jgi:hypothetical protein
MIDLILFYIGVPLLFLTILIYFITIISYTSYMKKNYVEIYENELYEFGLFSNNSFRTGRQMFKYVWKTQPDSHAQDLVVTIRVLMVFGILLTFILQSWILIPYLKSL